VTFVDITDRRRAEEALRESEEQFRSLAEQSPNMIFINDLRSVVYVNERCVEIMGYRREEFYDPAFNFIEIVAPEYRQVLRENFRKHGEGWDVEQVEYELVTRDGGRIQVILNTNLITYKGRRAILGVVTDITSRKRAEEAMEQALAEIAHQNEELRKIDRIKDGLVRDVSHELKTPVAKHSMQLEVLKSLLREGGLEEKTARAVKVREASIRRQESVIRNILDLSRLEAGGRKYRIVSLKLDEAVREVLDDYRADFEASSMHASTHLEEVSVISDREMLWHVLSNIITNAIKFRTRTGRPTLDISLSREGEGALLTVSDNGIGLSNEEKKRVFERFYKGTPSAEGSGVGLSIARMITKDLGLDLWIESEGKGRGATLGLRFPPDRVTGGPAGEVSLS
jgi:PAS domain S-box-containing protein